MIDNQQRADTRRKLLERVRAQGPSANTPDLVETSHIEADHAGPIEFRPKVAGVDLAKWATENRDAIEANLMRRGAILFRGFGMASSDAFEAFARIFSTALFTENGEHPRESLGGSVHTPVFFPPERKLLWHNENTFDRTWPGTIWFCSIRPADEGGEMSLVDSRQVFDRVPARTRARFLETGVMYVRNYNVGLGRTWQNVFSTDSKAEVERQCIARGMSFEWREGDRLRTSCVRPAAILHPKTGEPAWTNQAQHWHPACLDEKTRQSMALLFAADVLPRSCFYGDGSPIEDATIQEIVQVYAELERCVAWQAGDVLMVDNILTAHGRQPFKGQRKHFVVAGNMTSYDDVERPESPARAEYEPLPRS